jgi:putative flippase GtrA
MHPIRRQFKADNRSYSVLSPVVLTLPAGPAQGYLPQLARYAGVGTIGTIIHFTVLSLLSNSIDPVVASTVGAIAGCLVNYRLSRSFVFETRRNTQSTFAKFIIVTIASIGLNAAAMTAFLPHWPILISQLLATGLVLLSGHAMNNLWTFREYHA